MNRRTVLGLGALLSLAPVASAQFAINWHTLTCGGTSTPIAAGIYTLQSSIGDPFATSTISAGQYGLGGGFLQGGGGGGPAACYANCDGSTSPPILNVADFACFLNAFAAGSAYANCDGSTSIPVLNVADFACFLNRFAAGCS